MQNNYLEMFYKTKEFMRDLANERVAEGEKEAIEEKEAVDADIEASNNQEEDEKVN